MSDVRTAIGERPHERETVTSIGSVAHRQSIPLLTDRLEFNSPRTHQLLWGRSTAGRRTVNARMEVRFLSPQPTRKRRVCRPWEDTPPVKRSRHALTRFDSWRTHHSILNLGSGSLNSWERGSEVRHRWGGRRTGVPNGCWPPGSHAGTFRQTPPLVWQASASLEMPVSASGRPPGSQPENRGSIPRTGTIPHA